MLYLKGLCHQDIVFMPIRDRPFFIRVGGGGWWDMRVAREKNMALKEDLKEKKYWV